MRSPHATQRWRIAFRVLAAGLLVSAAVVLVLQVEVTGADGGARACGSSFDVIAGRVDWQQWNRADIAELPVTDVAHTAESPVADVARTAECPSAVNRRTGLAGGLAIGGAMLLAVAVGRWPTARKPEPPLSRRRLARLATVATAAGAVLTAAGLIGLGIVLANPRSTLFLYASRGAVLLIGLALLQPTLALLVVGLALRVWVRARSTGGEP